MISHSGILNAFFWGGYFYFWGAKALLALNAIAIMVAVDLRPYSIVKNDRFKELMKVVEPRYHMVSQRELTNTVIPEIVSDTEGKIKGSNAVIPKWGKLHYRHVEMRRAKPGIHYGDCPLGGRR
jgi:hypothetical protein